MKILGVTGGIGSGKSTACHFLQERGSFIFDADKEAKNILFTSKDVQKEIEKSFNTSIMYERKVNKQKLAKIAFANKNNQTILNNIIHPLVINLFIKKRDNLYNHTNLLVVDAALIFESGFDKYFDLTLLIFANQDIRLGRALERGNLSREQIIHRMNLQIPEEQKQKLADYIIDNNSTKESLYDKINDFYDEIM